MPSIKRILIALFVVALIVGAGVVFSSVYGTVELDTRSGRLRARKYVFGWQWSERVWDGELTDLLQAAPGTPPDWQIIHGSPTGASTNHKWGRLNTDLYLATQVMDTIAVSHAEQRRVLGVLLDACRTPGRVYFACDDLTKPHFTLQDDAQRVIADVTAADETAAPHILPANARP